HPTESQIVADLYRRGLSAPEISEETSIPSYKVRLLLKEQGIEIRGGKRNEKNLYLEEIRLYLSQGKSMTEVAVLIGKPATTVIRWCRQENLQTARESQQQQAVQLYRSGQDAKAVSATLGVAHATVLRWLHSAG